MHKKPLLKMLENGAPCTTPIIIWLQINYPIFTEIDQSKKEFYCHIWARAASSTFPSLVRILKRLHGHFGDGCTQDSHYSMVLSMVNVATNNISYLDQFCHSHLKSTMPVTPETIIVICFLFVSMKDVAYGEHLAKNRNLVEHAPEIILPQSL